MNLKAYGFTDSEIGLIKSLNTPEKIQKYIDDNIVYDSSRENRSVLEVIREKKAECFNAALFAFTCLKYHHYECSLIELFAKFDEEHMLAVYKKDGGYGAIAQSKFMGLKFRHPMYQSLRDLVVSYVEYYFAFDGRYSLQSYSRWRDFGKYQLRYLNNFYSVNKIGLDIRKSVHNNLSKIDASEFKVDPERYWNEIKVLPPDIEIPEIYLNHKKNLKRKTNKTK